LWIRYRGIDMQTSRNYLILLFAILIVNITGCAGVESFGVIARGGDTVSLATGYTSSLSREKITVTITDKAGTVTTYLPNDPAVRALVNVFPDPLSYLMVGGTSGKPIRGNEVTWTTFIDNLVTNKGEFLQSLLFLNLPSSMATGNATISIMPDGAAEPLPDITVKIVSETGDITSNTGAPASFDNYNDVIIDSAALRSLERSGYKSIDFSTTSTIPHAIQIDITHGNLVGEYYDFASHVVNPRGDLLNIAYKDDGANFRAILTPVKSSGIERIEDFKFYISGGVEKLSPSITSVSGYDVNGNPVVINAIIQ